ncbi:MAG: TetR family transcriptional regulator [Sporichthyaceae bacterium]|nr:TetR family transcriptional regulator [Sporichthyaceae bacterium]
MPRPSVEAQRRAQILQATCEVIAERGFRAVRVADVADRAGTSTGTVHYYFDTKRELIHAAFEHNFAESLQRRSAILASAADPHQRLVEFVDSYLPTSQTTVTAWRVWTELWGEALHTPGLQELNDSVYGEWRRVVAGIIRDGQARNLFRTGDPVGYANALIAMIDGLAIQVLLGSKNMTVARMREVCHSYVQDLLVVPA